MNERLPATRGAGRRGDRDRYVGNAADHDWAMNEQPTTPITPLTAPDWGSTRQLKIMVLVAATAAGIALCYRMAVPFLPSLAWSLVLAVLCTPLQRWLESKLKRPGLAAAVSVVLVGLIVLIAGTLVGQRLVVQAAKGAELLDAKVNSGEWRQLLNHPPQLARIAAWIEEQIDLPATVKTLAAWLSTFAGSLLKGSAFQAMSIGLTFYFLFFFLRDRRAVLNAFRDLVPLPDAETDRILARIGETIFATIYGSLVVAFAQGLLGGLMFWWLGLPAPVLWGVIMALLALVPMLGAFLVWIPAALLLAAEGRWGQVLLLTLWGMFVISTIDNVLRPILVGNRLKLHTLLVFISVVGGLILFGPTGLVLGPVILTVTTGLLESWKARQAGAPVTPP